MKKLISLLLVGIMMFSVCCISASAEQTTYDLGNGVSMILSDESLAPASKARTVSESFGLNLAVYPTFSLVKSGMRLGSGETRLEINFSELPVYPLYISLYDETADRYVTVDRDGMCIGPLNAVSDVVTFTGLTSGHSYRIRMATLALSGYISGTILSY